MNMFVIDMELFIRLLSFAGILGGMALWELIIPKRTLNYRKPTRWANNLSLTFFNSILVYVLFPLTAVGTAQVAFNRGWGGFNAISLPEALSGPLAVIILDLVIYSQHVVFHRVPVFWRIHRMHHTDLDVDMTTGARFHPIEIIISMGLKMGVVLALGAPAWSVIVFEVFLNATSMFNHGNVSMNTGLDRVLRLLVVTPDMHRVHHSVVIRETNSNFGFNFPWWDRLFRTYRAQPEAGHTAMTIGLADYRDPKWLTLQWMFAIPFRK